MSSIDPSAFTERTNKVLTDATQAAVAAASSSGTAPVHLFQALLEESSGFARRVLVRSAPESSADAILASTKQAVAAMPQQNPPPTEAAPNMALIKLLQSAQMASKSAGDTVTSLSHLLMASLNDVRAASLIGFFAMLQLAAFVPAGIHQEDTQGKQYQN
jgi:ATP-dependent Clp protease ATP-binding subunit ClpA